MRIQNPLPGRPRAALCATALSALLVVAPVQAQADAPSPTPPSSPAATLSPAPSPVPTPTPASSRAAVSPTPVSPTPVSPTPRTPTPTTPTPTSGPVPSVTPEPGGTPTAIPSASTPAELDAQARAADIALSLQVTPTADPASGRFYQDVGRFAFAGAASELADATTVEVYRRRSGSSTWTRVAQATVTGGRYAAARPVTAIGRFVFVTTTGGAPGTGDEVASPAVAVEVRDATVFLTKPPATVDAVKKPKLTGSVVPARAGVKVRLEVEKGSGYTGAGTATTDKAGRFAVTFGHGVGRLTSYTVRASYPAANRDRVERSATRRVKRVAVLRAVVTATTADEVASTYRKGCPVGRSKLSTVTMNFYGRDKRMHRGVLIIRTDLVPEVRRAFRKAITARFPIAKLKNPNVYGGNDPKQMAANNTSGFNCRKVVGNPYAQSPHSYGIAIDVDTVQNPYRDSRGTWWPANGTSYIDRTPLRFGMLGLKSAMTRQLRSDGFFWGGLWSPGRDYQHFEYRG